MHKSGRVFRAEVGDLKWYGRLLSFDCHGGQKCERGQYERGEGRGDTKAWTII